jgi:magnesium-transporting ATPase (P-type)
MIIEIRLKCIGIPMTNNQEQEYYHYWSIPTADLQQVNNTTEAGLTSKEANLRVSKFGKNLVKSKKKTDLLSLLISQSLYCVMKFR